MGGKRTYDESVVVVRERTRLQPTGDPSRPESPDRLNRETEIDPVGRGTRVPESRHARRCHVKAAEHGEHGEHDAGDRMCARLHHQLALIQWMELAGGKP